MNISSLKCMNSAEIQFSDFSLILHFFTDISEKLSLQFHLYDFRIDFNFSFNVDFRIDSHF